MGERFQGRVVSGAGDLSAWMRKYGEKYRDATGVDLVPGSLNLELEGEWGLPREVPRVRLEADEVGVGMTLVPCFIEGLPAFIARTDKNESGSGRHARNIVEVVADVRLRDVLQVTDGDRVEIIVPRARVSDDSRRERDSQDDGGRTPRRWNSSSAPAGRYVEVG